MYDLVIRGGTIVDGRGGSPFVGDVAIVNGQIVVVGVVEGGGAETIDATGKIVTPGFVDIHTQYDGQATWDELLEPSSGHGVTTVIAGNCGVGFAPVRPGQEAWLVQLMEGVEDIPGTALHEGITWNWETFEQYLDHLATRHYAVDVGTYVAHGPVRGYVMGERGANNEPATPADVAEMAAIVKRAITAGAFGFSTSRTLAHKARDGQPVPGTFADRDELFGLAHAVADAGGGLFEVAPQGAGDPVTDPDAELNWMTDLAAATSLPVSFAMVQTPYDPQQWQRQLDQVAAAAARGLRVVPQVAARPFGMLLGLNTYHAFAKRPTFVALAARYSGAALAAKLREPDVREAILGEEDLPPDPSIQFDGLAATIRALLTMVYELGDPPEYEPGPDRTIVARAAAAGVEPLAYLYDLFTAGDGSALVMFPYLNYVAGDSEVIRQMMVHPGTALGLSDGGAHCRMICDASMPTYLLTHWVRDRTRGDKLPLEFVIRRQCHETAELVGLHDRGTLEVGKRADVNVIDLEHLTLLAPRAVDDLPAGGRRLLQDAVGYDATIVAGVVTRRHGHDTGARPGRLVRATR
jgi:N-acyl-D-amino-acid deacylase